MELLQGILGLYAQRADWFAGLLQAHIGLALTAIAMSGMIGLLTGIWIAEHPRIAPPVMGVCNVLYTIPAISLLGILIPFSGIGNKTAVIALTVYGIMPMVHNTYVGLTTLDPDILEAARGMGSTGTQALFRVKLPMAAGVILAGVRNMVVMTISVAGIASFVGAGGLGVAVYRGITIYDPAMTAAGSRPSHPDAGHPDRLRRRRRLRRGDRLWRPCPDRHQAHDGTVHPGRDAGPSH